MEKPTGFKLLETHELSVSFEKNQVVKGISLTLDNKKVLAIIGPSGCGKSTFLRALNRMHDFTPEALVEGKILFDGKDISIKKEIHPIELRKHIGMLFQKPNPFPKSIYKNIEWALKMHGFHKSEIPGESKIASNGLRFGKKLKIASRTRLFNFLEDSNNVCA